MHSAGVEMQGQVNQVLDLARDNPAARMSSTLSLSTLGGVMARGRPAKRSHTVCAALTEICWPTMLRASVVKASPRDCKQASPNCGINRFMTRSLRIRCLQASSQ
jgi:hypothetical protein